MEAVLPVGPIDPATKRGRSGVRRLMRSASARAMRAAARFMRATCSAVRYSACEMACALNVQVSMMSAPASKYSRWMSAMTSGRVRTRMSLSPSSLTGWSRNSSPRKSASASPARCIMVPIAPSSTRMRLRIAFSMVSAIALGFARATRGINRLPLLWPRRSRRRSSSRSVCSAPPRP